MYFKNATWKLLIVLEPLLGWLDVKTRLFVHNKRDLVEDDEDIRDLVKINTLL